MSDASPSNRIPSRQTRCLSDAERSLLEFLVPGHPDLCTEPAVKDLSDGGMGSLRFVTCGEAPKHATELARACYTDDDGVLVSIVITVDQDGHLFEVDFWKVDFSRRQRFPTPAEVRRVSPVA
jgi:hypothetical protein